MIRVLVLWCAVLLCCFKSGESLTCLECKNIVQPHDCSTVTKCGPHEKCYTEKQITNDGHVYYNVGCEDQTICLRSAPFGKRDTTTICSNCCDSDLCNINNHCVSGGNPTFVNSLKYCYACSSGRPTSDDCNQITACAQDQLCQIKEIFNLFKEARWITGCAEKQQCDAISQQVHNECSNRCCGQNLCNAGCNNTTIPTVSTTQLVSKLSCTFDGKNTCFWASESNHQKGITQWEFDSSNKTLTGLPTQDHTTGQGNFLFAKMDSHHSGYISLTSPTFQPNVSYCLSLWYSTTDQNIMKLFVLDVMSRHRHVYRLVAQVGNEWKKFQTTLHQTYSFKIRIEAHIIAHSNRQQSPASIDDIKVLGGPCN